MTLLPNESVVSTDVKGLTLTNLRIRYTDGTFLSSMYLEELSSIHYTKEHKPFLVGLGILSAVTAAIMMTESMGPEVMAAAAVSVLSFVWYFMTRQTEFEIISRGGGKIELSLKNKGAITALVDAIESSKLGSSDIDPDLYDV